MCGTTDTLLKISIVMHTGASLAKQTFIENNILPTYFLYLFAIFCNYLHYIYILHYGKNNNIGVEKNTNKPYEVG